MPGEVCEKASRQSWLKQHAWHPAEMSSRRVELIGWVVSDIAAKSVKQTVAMPPRRQSRPPPMADVGARYDMPRGAFPEGTKSEPKSPFVCDVSSVQFSS